MVRKKLRNDKDGLVKRMRRVNGQVAGIVRMVQDDAYCIDVLTQIAAARAALLAAGRIILSDHMQSCVAESFKGGDSDRAIAELQTVLSQFVK